MGKHLTAVALGIICTFVFCPAAMATCSSYPHTLTNGTNADANQVMDNFNCAAKTSEDTLNATTFTGTTTISGSISGSGISNYLASPPAIGSTSPAAVSATIFTSTTMAKVFLTNSSSQSVPNNSAVAVTGWTVGLDATGMCNASTGICTAATTGDYLVNGHITLNGAAAIGTQVQCQIFLSGSSPATDTPMFENASIILHSCNAQAILHMTAGQTITLLVWQNSGGAIPIYAQGNTNWLNIEQLP